MIATVRSPALVTRTTVLSSTTCPLYAHVPANGNVRVELLSRSTTFWLDTGGVQVMNEAPPPGRAGMIDGYDPRPALSAGTLDPRVYPSPYSSRHDRPASCVA